MQVTLLAGVRGQVHPPRTAVNFGPRTAVGSTLRGRAPPKLQSGKLSKEIHGLKKQKEDAKRVENFTEANRLKEQLAEKEKEKAELGRRLQPTQAEGVG